MDFFDSANGQIDTVSSDAGARGSYIPLLATQLLALGLNRTYGFVPCALGATSITQWLPGADHFDRSTLYGSMAYRAQITGAKCILWWQGESDALSGMSQATYNAHLDTLANAINTDLGIKLMPCKLLNCSGADVTNINAAIAEAWGDNTNVLRGPDLSNIPSDDNFHATTNTTLAKVSHNNAGEDWYTRIVAAFYS